MGPFESACEALYTAEGWRAGWGKSEAMRQEIGRHLKAVIAALGASGWVIVPREPTEAMVDAPFELPHLQDLLTERDAKLIWPEDAWRAMLDAAPKLEES